MTTRVALRFRLKAWGTPQKPPTSFCLFYFGRNNTTKGPVYVSPEGAERCVAKWKARKIELAADYEHSVLAPTPEGAPASAWFDLAVGADGLYAVNVRWSERSQGYFLKGEYRYHSPFVELESDAQGKQWVVGLINFALTNWPATDAQRPLVARAFAATGRRTLTMLAPEKLKEVIDALGKTSLSEEEQAELVKVCASGEAMPKEAPEEEMPEDMPAGDTDPTLAASAVTAERAEQFSAMTKRLAVLEAKDKKREAEERAALFADFKGRGKLRFTTEEKARRILALGVQSFRDAYEDIGDLEQPAPKLTASLPTAKIGEALEAASQKTGAPVVNAEKAIPVEAIRKYMRENNVTAAKAHVALSRAAK
jgi:phage I-like protein